MSVDLTTISTQGHFGLAYNRIVALATQGHFGVFTSNETLSLIVDIERFDGSVMIAKRSGGVTIES